MSHGPSTNWGEDNASGYKTKLGMWLFLVYSIIYGGFVLICSVWPKAMQHAVGSLNIALAYGFALIGIALAMALIYNTLASRKEEQLNDPYTDDEEEVF